MENNGGTYLPTVYNNLPSTVLVGIATFLTFLAAIWLYQVHQKRERREKFLKKFDGPPADWLIGHVRHFTMDEPFFITLRKWINDYGGIIRMKVFGDDLIGLAEPESLAAIMKTPGPKDEGIYSLISQWIGLGLIISNGPHWFRNRRLLTPAFHANILKPYADVFHQTVTEHIKMWKKACNGKATCFDMFEILSLVTLESLMKTAFSSDVGEEDLSSSQGHPYIKAVCTLNQATMARINSDCDFIFYYLTSQGRQTMKALRVAKKFTRDILSKRKEMKKQKQIIYCTEYTRPGKYRDFVDMLLDAKDEDGSGLSDEEIMDEVDTFMFAGHDTTASGLSWFMYNMAKNPEHQERCREEIKEVMDGKDSITWSDLPNLEYLTMCIKESLRLHAPVPSVGRTLKEDLKLPDWRIIPSGTNIALLMTGMHYNPAVWENPDEFDPYRFSSANSQGRHSHAFVPFSAGPRNCIGQHFAMNELKIVASQTLKNFQVELDPDRPAKREFNLILRAKNGLWLKLTPL